QQIMAIVRLKDLSLATSGNYRNYYVEDGQTFAHIIDPRSGFNAKHNLLSASVFSSDCMTADAYATSFMVLGLEFSKKIIEANDLEAILIYRLDEGVSSYVSDGIRPFVELNKADKN
ncbi:MAG: FAD:protein FMN transferase, partial [Ekhidna sp.]|nr:FAD:protein FMN transferase [Ekhidna sp.]